MLVLRKILFFVFALIYIVACPFIILSSLGITFDPDTQTIAKTGIINISSLPSKAGIFINWQRYPGKTPAVIRDLPPGEYHIKLTQKNYLPWEKKITVAKQQATSLEELLLIPQKWPKETLMAGFEQLISWNDESLFLLKNGPYLKNLHLYKKQRVPHKDFPEQNSLLTRENITSLVDNDSLFFNDKITTIYTVDSSPFILIKTLSNQEFRYLWINLKETPVELTNISRLILEEPDKILWFKENGRHIFLLYKDKLSHLNINEEAVYPDIVSEVKDFTLFNNEIYLVSEADDLYHLGLGDEKPKPVVNMPELNSILKVSQKNFRLFSFPDNLMAFLSEKGALILNQSPYLFLNKDVRGLAYDSENRRLMVFTGTHIGYIDFKVNPQDPLWAQEPKLIWLPLADRNIKEVFWANNGKNILYCTTEACFVTETDPRNQPAVTPIEKIKANSMVHYRDRDGVLYYLNPEKGFVSAAAIIPQRK